MVLGSTSRKKVRVSYKGRRGGTAPKEYSRDIVETVDYSGILAVYPKVQGCKLCLTFPVSCRKIFPVSWQNCELQRIKSAFIPKSSHFWDIFYKPSQYLEHPNTINPNGVPEGAHWII